MKTIKIQPYLKEMISLIQTFNQNTQITTMEKLREMRYTSDYEALQYLKTKEEEAIKEIFANKLEYHHDEMVVGYVIYLHRKIVETFDQLREHRKNRQNAGAQEKLLALQKELVLLKQKEANSQ